MLCVKTTARPLKLLQHRLLGLRLEVGSLSGTPGLWGSEGKQSKKGGVLCHLLSPNCKVKSTSKLNVEVKAIYHKMLAGRTLVPSRKQMQLSTCGIRGLQVVTKSHSRAATCARPGGSAARPVCQVALCHIERRPPCGALSKRPGKVIGRANRPASAEGADCTCHIDKNAMWKVYC